MFRLFKKKGDNYYFTIKISYNTVNGVLIETKPVRVRIPGASEDDASGRLQRFIKSKVQVTIVDVKKVEKK
jgi:hypothetical protein